MTDTNPETTPDETPAETAAAPAEAVAAEAVATEAAAEDGTAADAASEKAGSEDVAVVEEAPAPRPQPRANVTPHNPIWTVGRRKSSTARARMFPGGGNITINGRDLREYFNREDHQRAVVSPLVHSDVDKDVDIRINVRGGGITGQAGAIRMAIARGLSQLRPDLEQTLRDGGFMTRDARVSERKKYGRRGARRGFQFSKR